MKNRIIQLLCPYGNWSHSKGMQIVDDIAAKKMLSSFPNIIEQKLFSKIPIYEGHPDDNPSKKSLLKPVGFIEKLIPLKDGIAIVSIYNDLYYNKLLSKELKALSPRWKMQELKDGTYRPVKLISAGLTNNPNIPQSGKILSYTEIENSEKSLDEKIFQIKNLGDKINRALKKSEKCVAKSESIASIQNFFTESITKKLLAKALNDGILSANECAKWKQQFSQDFSSTKKSLVKISTANSKISAKELIALTKEQMEKENQNWQEAFALIKQNHCL